MLKYLLQKLYSVLFLKRHQCLNLFATFYVNIMSLPLKHAIKFPVLIYGKCYVVVLKGRIFIDGNIRRGMFKIGLTDPVRSYEHATVLNFMGDIHIKETVYIRRGFRIQINPGATVNFGDMVTIGDNVTMICNKQISIGDNSEIGNNCVFMDTDFHYIINTESKSVRTCSKPIYIGENNWIAGYNVIKKGAVTPDGTIVAGPYSMLGKDYTDRIEPYSVIGGSPAKLIANNYRRIKNMKIQLMLHQYFKNDVEAYQFPIDANLNDICLPKNSYKV